MFMYLNLNFEYAKHFSLIVLCNILHGTRLHQRTQIKRIVQHVFFTACVCISMETGIPTVPHNSRALISNTDYYQNLLKQ